MTFVYVTLIILGGILAAAALFAGICYLAIKLSK